MGIDATSYKYPFSSYYQETDVSGEGHQEPGDESIKSSVVDAEHPLISSTGMKKLLNLSRGIGNAPEEQLLTGDIPDKVIGDLLDAAGKTGFPLDVLMYAVDYVQKLDERSSAGDAEGIAQQYAGYAQELTGVLGRQPLNSEVLAAGVLGSAGQVKTILEKAQQQPNEQAQPLGSQYDNYVFYKMKSGENKPRNNKEVWQYFNKRMVVGNDVFPHFPLGRDTTS